MYFHFPSFVNIWMAQLLEILPHRRQAPIIPHSHACWCPWGLISQGISKYGIDLVLMYTPTSSMLTHWSRVTQIYVDNLTSIASDNGLPLGRRQAIIWNNAGMLLFWLLGTNFSEIFIEIHISQFKKIHLKKSPVKCRLFCLGLTILSSCRPSNQFGIKLASGRLQPSRWLSPFWLQPSWYQSCTYLSMGLLTLSLVH